VFKKSLDKKDFMLCIAHKTAVLGVLAAILWILLSKQIYGF
jgi:hypothetical protein